MMSTQHAKVVLTQCHSQRQQLEGSPYWRGEWMDGVGSLLRHGSSNEEGQVYTVQISLTLGKTDRVITRLADA